MFGWLRRKKKQKPAYEYSYEIGETVYCPREGKIGTIGARTTSFVSPWGLVEVGHYQVWFEHEKGRYAKWKWGGDLCEFQAVKQEEDQPSVEGEPSYVEFEKESETKGD